VNADLAPTIARLAGAKPGLESDGVPLLPIARHPEREPDRDLFVMDFRAYEAVRTPRFTYAEHRTGEKELYDLKRDPYQLRSLDGAPRYRDERRRLAAVLDRLRDCAGPSCR
jgi:arylsulfatase A-like enzyme